jgi:putative FmdB family regulatory protein
MRMSPPSDALAGSVMGEAPGIETEDCMPLYEFECLDCGDVFERLMSKASEKEEAACPACGSHNLEEKISSFASTSSAGDCAPSGG